MWEALAYIVGGGAVGVIFKAAWDGINRRTELHHEHSMSNRRETRVEFTELINRLQLQIDGLNSNNKTLTAQVVELTSKCARAITWIENLEEKLDENNIPHRKWSDCPEDVP